MEVEKGNWKSNGLFSLFDWGKKKSRKKLFANGSPSSEKAVNGKESVDSVSSSQSNLGDDADVAGPSSSIKQTSEHSCSSSITDEEGITIITKKPTSVVAKLMGLDSLPITSTPEPNSTPPLNSASAFQIVSPGEKRNPRAYISSPIERFQTEVLPRRSPKAVPITHYKLLSPLKSSNFASGRNAAQIMEVASRIIEPIYDSGFAIRGRKPVNGRLNVLEGTRSDLNSKVKGNPRSNLQRISKKNDSQKRSVLVQNNRKQNYLVSNNNSNSNSNSNNNNNNSTNKSKVNGRNYPYANASSSKSKIGGNRNRLGNSVSGVNRTKNNSNNNIVVRRSERRIEHNILLDGQVKGNKKSGSTNIVSFTFTSPVDKSFKNNANLRSSPLDSRIKGLSSMGVIDGDYLGLLLEQKLRELTSGLESPYRKSVNCSAKNGKEYFGSCANEQAMTVSSEGSKYLSSIEDSAEAVEKGLKSNRVQESSLFTESCNSSESCESSKGCKSCASIQAEKTLDSFRFNEGLEIEEETEFSESGSSTIPLSEISTITCSNNNTNDKNQELELVREILNVVVSSGDICTRYLHQSGQLVDPLLFDQLESKRDLSIGRKLLFDCVIEWVGVRFAYYFGAGYQLWCKGVLFMCKLSADDVFKQVWVEKGVEEECMVDLLVEGDMGNYLGKWVDFEIESFEMGEEIEREILSSLVDELVADLAGKVHL